MSAVPMKSLDPESDEEDQEIDESISSLKSHLKNCQKLGKYVEAQMTQNRIAELKEKQFETKIAKLKTSQEKEMKIYEGAHDKEVADLRDKWQRVLDEHDDKVSDLEKDMLAKHEKELEDCRIEMENNIPEKAHPSQEIVALKKREEMLAKQSCFEDAHKVKMEVLQMEQKEQEAWMQEREDKVNAKLQVIQSRKDNELQVFRAMQAKARQTIERNMSNEIDQYSSRKALA